MKNGTCIEDNGMMTVVYVYTQHARTFFYCYDYNCA